MSLPRSSTCGVFVRLVGSASPIWVPTLFVNLEELKAWLPGTCFEVTTVQTGLLLRIPGTTTIFHVREASQ
jgi:hypothetical protein